MSAPPKTELTASAEEVDAIRAAVRSADPRQLGEDFALAGPAHVAGLVALLSDPAVSGPIYDLPRPIDEQSVGEWVESALRGQRAGDTVLFVRLDGAGEVYSYSRFTVWPERASAEIAGAFRADMQNSGIGKAGALRSFGWMFESLGVRLICVTAALDNVRSANVIEAAGFRPMGEREGRRPDGSVRRSLYWEMSRQEWDAKQSQAANGD